VSGGVYSFSNDGVYLDVDRWLEPPHFTFQLTHWLEGPDGKQVRMFRRIDLPDEEVEELARLLTMMLDHTHRFVLPEDIEHLAKEVDK
jgi:hypothetical protein